MSFFCYRYTCAYKHQYTPPCCPHALNLTSPLEHRRIWWVHGLNMFLILYWVKLIIIFLTQALLALRSNEKLWKRWRYALCMPTCLCVWFIVVSVRGHLYIRAPRASVYMVSCWVYNKQTYVCAFQFVFICLFMNVDCHNGRLLF